MPKPINKAVLFRRQLFHAASAKTSGSVSFVGVQGAVFYFKADKEGIVYIDIKIDEDWENLIEDPILADKVHVVDIDFFIPEARVRFLPDEAETTLKFATAYGYPSVFIREDTSTRGERDQYSTPGEGT